MADTTPPRTQHLTFTLTMLSGKADLYISDNLARPNAATARWWNEGGTQPYTVISIPPADTRHCPLASGTSHCTLQLSVVGRTAAATFLLVGTSGGGRVSLLDGMPQVWNTAPHSYRYSYSHSYSGGGRVSLLDGMPQVWNRHRPLCPLSPPRCNARPSPSSLVSQAGQVGGPNGGGSALFSFRAPGSHGQMELRLSMVYGEAHMFVGTSAHEDPLWSSVPLSTGDERVSILPTDNGYCVACDYHVRVTAEEAAAFTLAVSSGEGACMHVFHPSFI